MQLIFGVRNINNIFYKEFFEDLSQKYKNFSFEITLSKPESNNWEGKTGRVTEAINAIRAEEKPTIYICGLKNMIEDVTEILKSKNLPKEDIHYEKYN
jgi:NAD(P)H-flavin reductase